MKGADRHARGGDMATRLNRIAMAADRRANALPTSDPERLFQIAQSDLALANLARMHRARAVK